MTHSHDVQKIHTHYLAAASSLEICEFTADLGAMTNSDTQHAVCAPPRAGHKTHQYKRLAGGSTFCDNY